jgi:hypothetical protein
LISLKKTRFAAWALIRYQNEFKAWNRSVQSFANEEEMKSTKEREYFEKAQKHVRKQLQSNNMKII